MLPEIPSTIALAGGAGGSIFCGSHHGTGLQAVTIFVLDGVLLVVEHGIQAFVQMRDVVAAVEVVIDKHFPVAMNVEGSAVEVVQLADAEGRNALDETAEKFGERGCAVL